MDACCMYLLPHTRTAPHTSRFQICNRHRELKLEHNKPPDPTEEPVQSPRVVLKWLGSEALALYNSKPAWLQSDPISLLQSQSASRTAEWLMPLTRCSLGKFGEDGSVASVRPLLQEQLEKSITFGANFVPDGAEPFAEAADAMDAIARAALNHQTAHMVTAWGGHSFTQRQDSPSLCVATYPLANDKHSVTNLPDYLAVIPGDPRVHAFMDHHGELCWQLKNTYAAWVDARRARGYMMNMMPAHTSADPQALYAHGDTPSSELYDEQALLLACLLLSGRFSDASIQGNLGREMLNRGLNLLTKCTGKTFYTVSLDNNEVYQTAFDTKYLNAGSFRASEKEELLFVFSKSLSHGVFISCDASTTDPTGQHRLLRSGAANRQAFFQVIYGLQTETYGAAGSFLETLAQQSTMDAFYQAFTVYGVNESVEQPKPWRVPGAHGGVKIGPQPPE